MPPAPTSRSKAYRSESAALSRSRTSLTDAPDREATGRRFMEGIGAGTVPPVPTDVGSGMPHARWDPLPRSQSGRGEVWTVVYVGVNVRSPRACDRPLGRSRALGLRSNNDAISAKSGHGSARSQSRRATGLRYAPR